MTRENLTQEEIQERIDSGSLVVFLDEEYGYRQWYWFPSVPESELVALWNSIDKEEEAIYMDPSRLPGEVVPIPEETDQSLLEDYCFQGLDEGEITYEQAHPNECYWCNGHVHPDTWKAHIHRNDDSWLVGPEEPKEKSSR